MNIILYKSSCICGFFQLLFILNYDTPLIFKYLLLIGITTSIINHRFTFKILKILDRLTMFIGVIIDGFYLYIITQYSIFKLLFIFSILCYFVSKRIKRRSNIFHISSHVLLTITHFYISIYIDNNCKKYYILC